MPQTPGVPDHAAPPAASSLRARLAAVLRRLRYSEPAMLRARVVQVLAVAAGAGITVPGVVDRWVGVSFTVIGVLAPWYQGRRTRADVWSQQTVDDLATLVAAFPGRAAKAKELLGKGIGAAAAGAVLQQLAAASTATQGGSTR